MAATDMSAYGALVFAGNGANRPLHQDRQILRASDLALEQATQDAMLARARRYLHGWGVVAGLVPEVTDSTHLAIGPGYGVTPLGDELFLPEAASLPNAADVVVLCCGPGPAGCEVIDPEALAAARMAAADLTVTASLIARPASREAVPRPGVPQGCAHPAATLLPSRRCGGVEFAILCSLPPSHQPQKTSCEALMPFVCGGLRGTPALPLPWESALGPEANFLVIADLTVTGGVLTAAVGLRRTLWPVALIQDWIASCLCPMLGRETPPRDGTFTPPIRDTSGPGRLVDPPLGSGEVRGLRDPEGAAPIPSDVAPLARSSGRPGDSIALPRDEVLRLRDRLDGNVTDIPGIGDIRARALAGIGVTTEGQFLAAPSGRLAAALHLPEAMMTEMKEELSRRHDLGLTFGR